MMATQTRKLDHNGIKFGTGSTIVLLIIAFVIDSWFLVAMVGIFQLCGGLGLSFAPYKLAYKHIIRRFDLFPAYVITDNPEPHRFSMLVGFVFNAVGALLLAQGLFAGWFVVLLVIALANLNFWLNFCVGCWFYYQMNRIGVPGFSVAPLTDA